MTMAAIKAPAKQKDALTHSASVLAVNLKALMAVHPDLNSNPKLGKKSGLGPSAISRIINGHNATVETLDRLAEVFHLDTWLLLMPGLDPKNLPTFQPLSENEAQLYRRFKDLAKDFKEVT